MGKRRQSDGHEQRIDTTQTTDAGAGSTEPRSHRRQGRSEGESSRQGAGETRQAAAEMPQLRTGGAEGQGGQVLGLRGWAEPPKQKE